MATRRRVVALGRAGTAARGVVFGIIGWLVIKAALQYDPAEAQGLQGALVTLREAAYGPYLLGARGAGADRLRHLPAGQGALPRHPRVLSPAGGRIAHSESGKTASKVQRDRERPEIQRTRIFPLYLWRLSVPRTLPTFPGTG